MFLAVKNDTGAVQPWEYLAAIAGTYKAGQLLRWDSGCLWPIDDACTNTPPYLCMADVTVEDDGIVPVVRVSGDTVYETQLSANAAHAEPGVKLQVSAGGLLADGAAEGTFEIVTLDGPDKGDTVRGRFV